jgi:GNAT superfamily N-acetyltransferase
VTTALTADRIAEALGLMQRFYAELALECSPERARAALEELLRAPQSGGWWFLESDGRTVGYFVLTLGFSLEFAGRFALLDEFFVLTESRSQGIGGGALREAEALAAAMGASALRLEVDRNDARLCGFYRRSGFASHGRDIMTKWLPR